MWLTTSTQASGDHDQLEIHTPLVCSASSGLMPVLVFPGCITPRDIYPSFLSIRQPHLCAPELICVNGTSLQRRSRHKPPFIGAMHHTYIPDQPLEWASPCLEAIDWVMCLERPRQRNAIQFLTIMVDVINKRLYLLLRHQPEAFAPSAILHVAWNSTRCL